MVMVKDDGYRIPEITHEDDIQLEIADRKYTFIKKWGDSRLHILRYGEPWMVMENNAVHELVWEFSQLKKLVS